jgi:hypothetical protein
VPTFIDIGGRINVTGSAKSVGCNKRQRIAPMHAHNGAMRLSPYCALHCARIALAQSGRVAVGRLETQE